MIDRFIGKLASLLREKRRDSGPSRFAEDEVIGALESAVEGTDGKIRLAGGYSKKLRPAVESSLEYVDALVDMIPGLLEINRHTFVSDPRVRALFATADDLEEMFSRSSELQRFLVDDQHLELKKCCALLCMKKTERHVRGMELDGDTIRRDVAQITVNFSEHRIQTPAVDEGEAREGLKQCMYQSLVTSARDSIVACRASNQVLDTKRRTLHTRLRTLNRTGGQALPPLEQLSHTREITGIERRLQENEDARRRANCVGPSHSLEQLRHVLGNPEEYVRLNNLSICVNQMGVKLEQCDRESGHAIDLAEVELGVEYPRVLVLASFPRPKIRPRRNFVVEADRYL